MAKTVTEDVTSAVETKKQRKKQAKQEAKTMLKIEEAKKDVHKAEQRLARAQSDLESFASRLRTFEEKLAKIRAPQQTSHNGVSIETSIDQPQVHVEPRTGAATSELEGHTAVSPPTDQSGPTMQEAATGAISWQKDYSIEADNETETHSDESTKEFSASAEPERPTRRRSRHDSSQADEEHHD